ncbi:MAG: short-chain dehydrogenase, partial [Pseudomonadota bacterium]
MREIETVEEFAFNLPLYEEVKLPQNLSLTALLVGNDTQTLDGYCPFCCDRATFAFQLTQGRIPASARANLKSYFKPCLGFRSRSILCTRNGHEIKFYFLLSDVHTLQKVGQYPSLADIANDEAAQYRSVLNKEDASEFHKAIGLAAHGVGIGSFVYLRRIFERLIYGRFEEFREAEQWNEEEFKQLRMDEKVKYLEGHIPDFLVENRRLYSILSEGIHELDEETCLKVFSPIKKSMQIILEEDKKRKEELALREEAAQAIRDFSGGAG